MSWWDTLGNEIRTMFGGRDDLNAGQNAALNTVGSPLKGGMSRNQAAMNGDFDAATKSFKKGGTVKKTGIYKLHKGEEVLAKKKADLARKMSGFTQMEKYSKFISKR